MTFADIPELAAVLDGADHVDVKTVSRPRVLLREFVAGALGFRPGWLVALFAARVVFAWLLRLRHAVPSRVDRPPTADGSTSPPAPRSGSSPSSRPKRTDTCCCRPPTRT